MKKLIPILSLALGSAIMQNCSQRDEDIATSTTEKNADKLQDHPLIGRDSTQSSDHHLDPDPPVRDGDDWRTVPTK